MAPMAIIGSNRGLPRWDWLQVVAIGLMIALAVVASGCGGNGTAAGVDSGSGTSGDAPLGGPVPSDGTPDATVGSGPTTSFGGFTTTTVVEAMAVDCDPNTLGLASLAVINPAFSTVDSYGCSDTHAWVWMSRGDDDPDDLLSVLFVDGGGLWRAMDTVTVCAMADTSAIAADVVANGCAHL